MLHLKFQATVIDWRGPAPFAFAPIPAEHVDAIRQAARHVTYGWGMIPVEVVIGSAGFVTSLFPKDDTYLLPLKVAVRRKLEITVGDMIDIDMTIQARR